MQDSLRDVHLISSTLWTKIKISIPC